MVDEKQSGLVTLPRPPMLRGDGRTSPTGVIKIVGDTQLPREFITVGKDFDDALGRTNLLDDNQLNDVIAYKSQLMEFDMYDELEDLTSWLNGRPAVGGYNRNQALMAHIGIAVPEAFGTKLSKQGVETLKKANEWRNRGKNNGDEQSPG
jgi:hypothetical protein